MKKFTPALKGEIICPTFSKSPFRDLGLIFLACCLLFTSSFSQTFSFINNDTIKYASTNGSQFGCYDTLINNSSTGFYVNAVRMVNDTAPNWQTGFCLDVCYPPPVDSASVYLLPNGKQLFLLDFFPDTLPDSSTVLMKFTNAVNPSNVVYQRFYGITQQGLGVNSLSNETSVKIFPAPVSANSTFCFRIIDKKNGEDFNLMLYDVYGKKSTVINGLMNGDNYLSLNLSEGMYVYSLLKGTTRVKTGKIAVAE